MCLHICSTQCTKLCMCYMDAAPNGPMIQCVCCMHGLLGVSHARPGGSFGCWERDTALQEASDTFRHCVSPRQGTHLPPVLYILLPLTLTPGRMDRRFIIYLQTHATRDDPIGGIEPASRLDRATTGSLYVYHCASSPQTLKHAIISYLLMALIQSPPHKVP